MDSSLNLLIWNCNSIKGKINELEFICNERKLDIVALCETKIDQDFSLKINGYTTFR